MSEANQSNSDPGIDRDRLRALFERIERCLIRMAQIIVATGDKSEVYLPIQERLERELQARRDVEVEMARGRACASVVIN